MARAFLAGEQDVTELVRRGEAVLGKPQEWLAPLATRYVDAFAGQTRPRHRDVLRFLLRDAECGVHFNAAPGQRKLAVAQLWLSEPSRMLPVEAAASWAVPPIESAGALAEWLNVSIGELEWFADLKSLARRSSAPRLHHYRYRLLEKRNGGVRLIEAPQARLKAIQRRILSNILERVPHYYSVAHGFVKGRSVVTYATPHVGQRVVLRMDLQDFFPRIRRPRVQAMFRTIGYPETVADALGGICTNATPYAVFSGLNGRQFNTKGLWDVARQYAEPHVPQGAPTSPLLANMCAYRLDCRLTGLADWAGAVYTRYADDLAFSGGEEFQRNIERYATQIAAIALDEGWNVQHRKTRVMRPGGRQQLAGLVLNQRVNISRESYDTLKAILVNCVRHRPVSQNRDGHADLRLHLAGRVAWVTSFNPARGRKLRDIFNSIDWHRPDTRQNLVDE